MCEYPPKARYRQHRRVRRGWLCSAECTTELADFVERSSPALRPLWRPFLPSNVATLKTVVLILKKPYV